MNLLIYKISIFLMEVGLRLASIFNTKAKLFVLGRENIFNIIKDKIQNDNRSKVWFHFASLGEYEQGRPVLEKYKTKYPEKAIVATFFSPSGYENKKNMPMADYVFYLPLDTKDNAKKWFDLINPEIFFSIKYEYWYFYFREAHNRNIPIYIISAIFKKNFAFFKWYGKIQRDILKFVTHFFIQDKESAILLSSINFNNYTISGDTRFDRVFANSQNIITNPIAEAFSKDNKTIIIGSSWLEDEKLIFDIQDKLLIENKIIIAPHEVDNNHINKIISLLKYPYQRYSEIKDINQLNDNTKILIIDCIGILSSLYQYANWTYIGGGFNKSGIHNTLEAITFGKAVVFGPNYHKFQEALDIIKLGIGFSVKNSNELFSTYNLFTEDKLKEINISAKKYIYENINATDKIFSKLNF